ncbi:hypothetical protein EZ428_03755 [Pedobacter frigiditerrae]|uniref:Uncharacterized protein n=1 Tax=Pedobacter frigiditerrae TaxID=2530452 RepID=A0A4R0N3G1_9SPHI|nr:DUF6607 family protein [Pedobacter frigiditerrae]TCC93897.1 hypothetical protein EZ428_03755 [Pedobacter frigiditerrae]
MKKLHLLFALISSVFSVTAQNKIDQDREAIKSLAGFYKVTFNYAETFSPEDDYKFHERHRSSAKEIAILVEDSPRKIVIQHLLVMRGDSMIIKHWREDWTYEDQTILAYDKDNAWKKVTLSANDVKGKWTQKVFQVDDSPRYQAIGTWVHVDGRHQWQSNTDSPLPRRESTERNDYNVLNRGNNLYLTANGWMFEQDNKKIVRADGRDKLIAMEKGMEEFIKTDSKSFGYAQTWWKQQEAFWKDARASWDAVFAETSYLKLNLKVENKLLYEQFFALGDRSTKEKWSSEKNKENIKKVIQTYLVKAS